MASVTWDDQGVTSLVQTRIESAALPVVLCAPHGGNAVDGDQSETLLERPVVSPPPKDGENGGSSGKTSRSPTVSLVADIGTAQLLEEIDRRIIRKYSSGGDNDAGFATAAVDAPAAVVARFHRKYVDANRSLENECAVATHPSCARAREVHKRYHRAIEAAIGALGSRCCHAKLSSSLGSSSSIRGKTEEKGEGGGGGTGKGGVERHEGKDMRLLLLDIHGQSKFVDKVIIGTCHGKTADLEALNVPGKGFLWHLRGQLNGKEERCGDRREGVAPAQGDKKTNCSTVAQQRQPGETGGMGKGRDRECQGGQAGGQDDVENAGVAIKRDKKATRDDLVVVLPSPGEKEVAGYTGGYTVKRHGLVAAGQGLTPGGTTGEAAVGAAAGGGAQGAGRVAAVVVDAVQLEFGVRFRRTPEARAAAAEAVATAIFHHLQQH